MVGDLVVAREGRVDRGPPLHHVREHAVDDQVAHHDAHRRAHERVHAAAVAARLHVAADRAQRGRPLEDHLPDEEDEHARDVEPVRRRTRGSPGLACFSASIRLTVRITWSASPESRLPRLAPPSTQQADAGRAAALDLRAVGRRRAGHHPPGLLLHPAERGDVLVRAEQDPGLAGPGLRGEIGLPLGERGASPSASQRAISGALPSRIARRSTGSASPSISRKTIPGTSVTLALARPTSDPLDHAQRVRSSSFVPRTTSSTTLDSRRDERGEERPAEGVDAESRSARASAASINISRVERTARARTRAGA